MQSPQIEGFRLSPQQRYVHKLQGEGHDSPYGVQGAILITGNLNVESLGAALQGVVDRYEILRTAFQVLPGMSVPLQVIVEDCKATLSNRDLTHLSSQDQESEIESFFDKLKRQTPQVEENSVTFAHLFKLSSERHILFIYLSALVADGITLKQIVGEILDLYAGASAAADDAEIMQYADIAEWQNELLEEEEYSLGKEYWQNQLAVCSQLVDLEILGKKISQQQAFQIDLLAAKVDGRTVENLKALSRQSNVEISTLLLACWQVLLWRLAGRQELAINVVSDGRSYAELGQVPGPLSRSLPLPIYLEGDLPFEQIIHNVSDLVGDAYKWQDYFTWEKAISEDGHVLSPFCFEFEEWPEAFGKNGISFALHNRYVCRERLQLGLFCLQTGDALSVEFYYDGNLYKTEEIKELSEWFLRLLGDLVDSPDAAVGQLSFLSSEQQTRILKEFNQTQVQYPPVAGVHQWFEQQVDKVPDAVAVVSEDHQLTYAELNVRANRLAHYLRRLGIGNESLVGIYLERSLEVIVGLLAVLKAGGAYIPLDPALPREGLMFRLGDAKASALLTQEHLATDLSELGASIVCVDSQWDIIAQESQANPNNEITPENLAYVLFTSGSTGKPKGVAVEHRQLLNYTNAIAENLNLTTCKSFATVSTFAADLGNTAVFSALLSGGCLHIISAERASNPETLADYFGRYPIDCLKIVPSHLAALLTSSRPRQILPQQRLVLGGEACSWQLIEQIYGYEPSCEIFNHYGPTETTVGVLTYAVDSAALQTRHSQQATVPVGRPIANTQIYLLDADRQPVPIGVAGEIYIGGAGVARGYFNQPELTAERFIANPFGQTLEETPALSPILYRTGDLARYRADGTVEFLGRADHQVKIRGYRIEPGEIENAIRQYPAIRETVVLAREAQSGNKRLVAYVVPEKQSNLVVSELRDFLKQKLADYMLPAAFVSLKALPLTPNGKLDRRALPAPELVQQERQTAFVAPGTEAEKTLADIWAKTLGIEKIGVHDNFFELGGDSILSIQIVARANQAGLKLTPKQVFENQTIVELAAVANTQQIVQAEQGPVLGPVTLTPIQHWFFEQCLPESHHWNQSLLLEVRQPLDFKQLEQAVQKLLKHHDALRLRFVEQDGRWQQHCVESDGIAPLTQIDLSSVAEADQTSAISAAAAKLQASLNLESGPLLRVAYFDLGADKSSRLLFIIHHLVVDGVSWRILLEDLQIAHQQLSQGAVVQLSPKTTSFKFWAEQLANYAQSDWQQQELDYWLRFSSQQVVPLPVDFLDNDNSVAKSHTVSVTLDEAETSALLQDVPAAYRTQINDVLLTALVQSFARWTGERCLLVDLEGHGREEELFENVDVSRTVGWFTSIFPVLLDLRMVPETSLGDALKTIKEQLRSVPNRGIGYGILRYLSERTDWQPSSSEVRFNYLGQTDQVLPSSSMFAPAQEPIGPGRSTKGERSYRLDINSVIAGGRLQVDWTYSEAIHQRATVEMLASGFIEMLRSLISHCQSSEAGGYTPSDFSEANLNQQELDQFLTKLKGKL